MEAKLNFTWTVRVRTGQGKSTATFRNHSIPLGRYVSFDEKDDLPTTLEAGIAALGAEVADAFGRLCDKKRIEIDALETRVNVCLENPLMTMGVIGETGSPAIESCDIVVYCSSDSGPDLLASIFEEARLRCPLLTTLSLACKVTTRFIAQP